MDLYPNENEQSLLPETDLAAEIQRLQEELKNERDRNLRTLADFKNYRRRIEREGSKIAEERIKEMILVLLEIMDDMEKLLQYANDTRKTSLKGVQIIHKKFLALLETHEVFPFESVGATFDHNLHDAVALAKNEESKPGTIVDELRRGYIWNNELLRAAQVRVSE